MSDKKTRTHNASIADDPVCDRDVIDLLFARSEDGLTLLRERYGKLCRRIAMNLLGNAQDAEECESDVCLAVWNTIPPNRPSLCQKKPLFPQKHPEKSLQKSEKCDTI